MENCNTALRTETQEDNISGVLEYVFALLTELFPEN
jgi:hypothetical protein